MTTAAYKDVLHDAQQLDPIEQLSLLREVAEHLRQDDALMSRLERLDNLATVTLPERQAIASLRGDQPDLSGKLTEQLDSFVWLAALLLGVLVLLGKEAQTLTPEEQARLREAMEEISAARGHTSTADDQWDQVFAKSHDKHQKLAAKLRADMKTGRTRPLDLGRL